MYPRRQNTRRTIRQDARRRTRHNIPGLLFAVTAATAAAVPVVQADDVDPAAVVETYAAIAHAGYEDSLITARELRAAVSRLVEMPADLQIRKSRYLSSVAVAGRHVVFTSAPGGLAFRVDRDTDMTEESLSILDCSGVVAAPAESGLQADSNLQDSNLQDSNVEDGYVLHDNALDPSALDSGTLVTSGTGEILRVSDDGVYSLALHSVQWDNHVYRL